MQNNYLTTKVSVSWETLFAYVNCSFQQRSYVYIKIKSHRFYTIDDVQKESLIKLTFRIAPRFTKYPSFEAIYKMKKFKNLEIRKLDIYNFEKKLPTRQDENNYIRVNQVSSEKQTTWHDFLLHVSRFVRMCLVLVHCCDKDNVMLLFHLKWKKIRIRETLSRNNEMLKIVDALVIIIIINTVIWLPLSSI